MLDLPCTEIEKNNLLKPELLGLKSFADAKELLLKSTDWGVGLRGRIHFRKTTVSTTGLPA